MTCKSRRDGWPRFAPAVQSHKSNWEKHEQKSGGHDFSRAAE